MRRIAILFHERDRPKMRSNYIARAMAPLWREWGVEVVELHGTAAFTDADLLIPQVDLSVMPESYQRFIARFPNVMNRRVRDISKSVISSNRVQPDDEWEGPVIVKTDRNCGGVPERRIAGRLSKSRARRRLRRWLRRLRHGERDPLSAADFLRPHCYPIFPSALEVPPAVFENPALFVERFLPEMDGDLYCLRNYTFCGDRHYAMLRRSTKPIVKASAATPPEPVSVPDSVVAFRRRIGLDFGKIDYVVGNGEAVVLDANWTPTFAAPVLGPEQRERVRLLAEGVFDSDLGPPQSP